MSDLLKAFGPWAVYLVVMGGMLKWLVTDKLSNLQATLDALTESIAGHDQRIRDLETAHAELMGGLKAKGCMDVQRCGRS
jgi:hypothetical protein